MSKSIREFTGHHLVPPEKDFRWRGGEITRLEGFTDAVFAFAVTLLVVSLEVPRTFAELVTAMKGFVAFAVCFTILVQIWYFHYKFSRRYGLQTMYTVVLTAALIFVVLFYVYPLKFLFTLAVGGLSGGATVPVEQLNQMVHTYREISQLWLIYSAGVIAVYLLLALLYQYAYKKRRELELNEYETMVTRHEIIQFSGFVAVGVLVGIAALVVPAPYVSYAGILFCLNAPWGWAAGSFFGKRQRQVLAGMQANSSASAAK
ncbi:MAG TPA: TMEM175 family protein [Candidatus Angelobacter sp.]|nr:TMEM175 family protein [Candidatus Angelobacter sp.]